MTGSKAAALGMSRGLLTLLIALNWFGGLAVMALFVFSLITPDWTVRALKLGSGEDARAALWAGYLLMAAALACVPLTHVVLTRLRTIVDTVREGDPFVGRNANRLRQIAWSLLGVQLLTLVIHGAAAAMSALGATIDLDDMGLSGWLAVLLTFVLARVFEEGTRMRDEIDELV